jgi:hypothetical protein
LITIHFDRNDNQVMATTTTAQTARDPKWGVEVCQQEPSFSWDLQTSTDPFFADIDPKDTNIFVRIFSEDDIQRMNLPKGELTVTEKISKLQDLVTQRLEDKERAAAPKTLKEVDYPTWQALESAVGTYRSKVEGDYKHSEKVFAERLANDLKDVSAIHNLAFVRGKQGNWFEEEKLARRSLAMLEVHESLGKDSPQALGARKMITEGMWKQGRKHDAKAYGKETATVIAGMKGGKFEKYQEWNKADHEEFMDDLEKWQDDLENR